MNRPTYTITHYIHDQAAIEVVATAPDGHVVFQTFTSTLSAGWDAAEYAIDLHSAAQRRQTADALGLDVDATLAAEVTM